MEPFLRDLARARPDPGGGAAAAFGARLGLALLEKIVQLEAQRGPRPVSAESLSWDQVLLRLRELAKNLDRLQAEDVRAYFNLTVARTSGDGLRLAAAVQEALACPRQIMGQAGQALELLAWAGERCKRHLASDLLVAGEFLAAALRGAYHIAGANLSLVPDEASRQNLAQELDQACREGEDVYQVVQLALMNRTMRQ